MTTKTKKNETTKDEKTPTNEDGSLTHEEIARRAYLLWMERGGDQLENWLEAERTLR